MQKVINKNKGIWEYYVILRSSVCVCYTNFPNRQIFKGISCGKIHLVTRVSAAVCSIRGLHIHFFSLSQMQMYVKKCCDATFSHKSSVLCEKMTSEVSDEGVACGEGTGM